MNLADLTDVKNFLELTKTEYDDLLNKLLSSYSARIETFLNRSLAKTARTETFNAGRKNFYLSAYPIDLTQPFTVVWETQTVTKDSDYYVWTDSGVVEFFWTPNWIKPQGIKITYTGGYNNLTDLPQPIQLATMMQVAFVFRRRKDIGLSSISMPDGSVSVNAPTKLLPEVVDILREYRRKPSER